MNFRPLRSTISIISVVLFAGLGMISNVRAQAWDKVYAKSVGLPAGGTDYSHLLSFTVPAMASPISITFPPTNVKGPLTNDGAGTLSWGGPAGIAAGSANQFLGTTIGLLASWNSFSTDNATILSGNGVSTSIGLNLGHADIWTAVQTLQINSIGTTPTDALVLANTTSAANNAQQYSPRMHFSGQGYKSSGLGSSQSVDWEVQNIPIQGTTNPLTRLDFENSIAGGSYSTSGLNLFPSGGATLGVSNPSDPGIGVFNAATGFEVGGPVTQGKMLIGNGTEFVPTSYAYPTTVGAAGNILWSNGSAFVSNQVTAAQFSPSDPTGTSSTTGKMMGLGSTATFTPGGSGIILILVTGNMTQNTNGDGNRAQIRWGTGSAPSNGASPTGTISGSNIQTTMANGLNVYFFCLNAIVGGGGSPLTVGTNYWIDVDLSAVTGGTASVKNVTISVMELE